MKMLWLGSAGMVACDRIVCIVSPDTSPVKRLVQDAKDAGRAIDTTGGKKTRSVILTDSDHVILSAIQAETICNRLNGESSDSSDSDDEE